jgi:hypothetical protein
MKHSILVLALLSTTAFSQTQLQSVYVYDGKPLPADRRYLMTREGADAARFEKNNPQLFAAAPTTPAARDYSMPAPGTRSTVVAPEWFTRLPEDSPQMLFSAGVGQSVDEQMAYDKARMIAERKLVELMSSQVRSLTKSYRADIGESMQERFESTVQKTANGELIGAQRVDSQATFDGRYYKVYVLLRYPLSENNVLRKEREGARSKREADLRAERAHQELEQAQQSRQQREEQADRQLKQEIGPRAIVPTESTVAPVVVPTEQGNLKLLDVENEEYKKKRAEALQKPGAVVGHVTVQ